MTSTKRVLQVAGVAVALLFATSAFTAQQVTIPEGTVIELRMDTGLNSGNSRLNDTFKAGVLRTVLIDGGIAVPEGSIVDGRVTTAQPAERNSHSGVIGVEFYRISINGRSYPIEGTLTSLRADERKQIIDEESHVQGKSSTPRNILFIGGGTGVGAVIGAVAGGGKGAGIGALTGGGLGVLGSLLSRGAEADVPIGAEVAMQLVRPVIVSVTQESRQNVANDRTLYTTASIVRGAQTALRERKYYDGSSTGRLDDTTRRAIAHYQIDNNQRATGDLDEATVASLGLVRIGPGSSPRDSHSVSSPGNRQIATDISRQALSLLDTYQNRLGVRAEDIRSKPQLSESDLDLLLQVQAFAKASVWYDQTSRGGQNGEAAFDNVGRILLRSAERVELGREAATQSRVFDDAWSSIQANLHQIHLGQPLATR